MAKMRRLLILSLALALAGGARAGVEEQFLRCVIQGQTSQVRDLLRQHPRLISARVTSGAGALHLAVAYGRPAIVRLLLQKGANLEAKDNFGFTPLHYAVLKKQHNLMKMLIDMGSDVNTGGESVPTPLHLAARMNDIVAIRLLLSKGADVNAQWQIGTPLHEAAMWRAEAAAQVLLERGASVSARNTYGATPMHAAACNDAVTIAQLLRKHGGRIDDIDNRRRQPLHYACDCAAREPVVRWLLDHGADPNAKDSDGETPLHLLASSYWRYKISEQVARRHHKPEAEIMAMRTQFVNNTLAVARLLVQRGAKIGIRNRSGLTAVDMAKQEGFTEMEEELLRLQQMGWALVGFIVSVCFAIPGFVMAFLPKRAFHTRYKPRWLGIMLLVISLCGMLISGTNWLRLHREPVGMRTRSGAAHDISHPK